MLFLRSRLRTLLRGVFLHEPFGVHPIVMQMHEEKEETHPLFQDENLVPEDLSTLHSDILNTSRIARTFARYRGHLGPPGPKLGKESENEFRGPLDPGAQKVDNGVEKESRESQIENSYSAPTIQNDYQNNSLRFFGGNFEGTLRPRNPQEKRNFSRNYA